MAPNGRMGRLVRLWPAAVLVGIYFVIATGAASTKCGTFDEMAHLTAGYSYWAYNDYRLHPENGNWPQRWAALPAVVGDFRFPPLEGPGWTQSNMYVMGDQFFYAAGNDPDVMLRRGRAMIALLGVVLGGLVFAWATRLISPAAGWVSLVLFAFSPTLLAHGALVTSDMAAALLLTAATGAMWVAWHRLTPGTFIGAAVLLAGTFLTKFSAPIMVVIAFALLLVRVASGRGLVIAWRGKEVEVGGRLRRAAILIGVAVAWGCITWFIIWASYGFRYSAFAAATTGAERFMAPLTSEPGLATTLAETARRLHLLPEAYIYGFADTMQYASARAAFLNGEFSTTGWTWYFPYSFLVKTTLPALLVGLLAIGALVARLRTGSARVWPRIGAGLYAASPLLALLGVYWLFAITSHLNIGHRHLLPVYPALSILAGAAAFWIEPLVARAAGRANRPAPRTGSERRKEKAQGATRLRVAPWHKALGAVTVALLAWHVVETVRIYPDYLAYFNQLAGGPSEGYRHLVDSSLDWGQDLPALKRWLDRNGLQPPSASAPVYLSYFGTARPEYYGIDAIQLAGFVDKRPQRAPEPFAGGTYCISATILNEVSFTFWTPAEQARYQPVLSAVDAFSKADGDAQARAALLQRGGGAFWGQTFRQYDQYRVGRLAAFLRQRKPDAEVGYSILVYRLTAHDVDAAINGPVPRK